MNIQAIDIKKSFGTQIVLSNWNCSIPENKTTCLMGPSGCGKTTFFRILLGLTQPDSGAIYGMENQTITAVFQENRLCNYLNAIKNIQLVCRDFDISRQKLEDIFEQVGLDRSDLMKPIAELSGGMQRRVAIVRAIVPKSTFILMDEPFRGLDTENKKRVINYIHHMTGGKTLLISTHDFRDVESLNAELIEMES
jgi:NitT/TauT family transport system ATP-binding protein